MNVDLDVLNAVTNVVVVFVAVDLVVLNVVVVLYVVVVLLDVL